VFVRALGGQIEGGMDFKSD